MQIYTHLDSLPCFRNPVVAVGSFDGVHLGHQRVFDYVKAQAARLDGESVVVTFDPHPQEVLHPDSDFFRINTMEENAEMIAEAGIDVLIVLTFTREFSQMTFAQFITLLSEKIGAKAIVMGPNHNFGKNREGNCKTIEKICAKFGIGIILIPELMMEENKIRSSKIREHIKNQNFKEAEKLLGHPMKKNQ